MGEGLVGVGHAELGNAYRGLGKIEAQLNAYREAVETDGQDIDAILALGASFAELKGIQIRGARPRYISASGTLQLDDPEQTFYFLAALVAMGMTDEARGDVPRLRKIDNALADALEKLLVVN